MYCVIMVVHKLINVILNILVGQPLFTFLYSSIATFMEWISFPDEISESFVSVGSVPTIHIIEGFFPF